MEKALYYQWFKTDIYNAIDLKHNVHFNLKKKWPLFIEYQSIKKFYCKITKKHIFLMSGWRSFLESARKKEVLK